MLTTLQKNTIFFLYIGAIIIAICLEAFFVLKVINGEISKTSVISGAIGSLTLFSCAKYLPELFKKHFLEQEIEKYFKNMFAQRLRSINRRPTINNTNAKEISEELILATLELCETLLKKHLGNQHYEISIFENKEHPVISHYYDSNKQSTPRSQNDRTNNENYYRDKGYTVVSLLENPKNDILYISDTQNERTYSFATDDQRKKLKSTLLYSFCLNHPRAIVITSNKKNAFSAKTPIIEEIVRLISNAVHCDCHLFQKIQPNP